MTNDDMPNFTAVMYGFAQTFNIPIKASALTLQFEVLKKYPLEKISTAVLYLIENWTKYHPPRIADIISTMGDGEEGKAEKAINQIMEAIVSCGYYHVPKWDDPVIATLLSSRWQYRDLCKMTGDQLKWWRKEFKEAYIASYSQYQVKQNLLSTQYNMQSLLTNITKSIDHNGGE